MVLEAHMLACPAFSVFTTAHSLPPLHVRRLNLKTSHVTGATAKIKV